MNTTQFPDTYVSIPNTIAQLNALIKKAEWMKEEASRMSRLINDGKPEETIKDSMLRANDFDDLNNFVREAFNHYTR